MLEELIPFDGRPEPPFAQDCEVVGISQSCLRTAGMMSFPSV